MRSKYRLLVVRLGAMGDILHALPAVTALRKAHPEWVIDWVVEPVWSALLTAETGAVRDTSAAKPKQPIVDRVHFAGTRKWRRNVFARETRQELAALRRGLKREHYDAVVDMQGAVRSALIGRMARSRRYIGEARPRESAAKLLFTEKVETRGAHVIEQDVELAQAIAGDELKPVQPMLPFDPEAEEWAEGMMAEGGGTPVVLINPGAGWGAKRWPVERYADVARGLLNRGWQVFVNAGPGEVALADEVVKRTGGGATALLGSVEQLIAITRRMSLAIAGDTGPLHLACALGRPVVGIYGPTDPARNGPFGTRFKVLRHPESQRDHTRRSAPEAGLLTITPAEVIEAAEGLLYSEAAR
ncbi:glycosyltransferase family 9 protein [Occallatibacter savannae]|uniref:glycosyltransferase family 9 protein n=1 Tax=Occallatibacter savannae TaxID=1002691 RepID=UPI000D69A14E|nr:glycosyltransferase family 9 protein [Occallatibacter savannae]